MSISRRSLSPGLLCRVLLCASVPLWVATCDSSSSSDVKQVDAGEPNGDAGQEVVTRTAALRAIAENAYRVTYVRFQEKATAMASAIASWRNEGSPGKRTLAQEAWLEANAVWQELEVMQVGPAGTKGRRVGGDDLRERIYSYPTTNPCRVDQELVSERYLENAWTDGALFNVQGLDALEYLLFWTEDENRCPDVVAINRQGAWAALVAMGSGVLDGRRAALASVLADAVVEVAGRLVETWDRDSEFRRGFVDGDAPFANTKEALDQVFAGLFYLDRYVKDLKLGKPAGITPDCAEDTCPDAVESLFAHVSKSNLRRNLIGFKRVFMGGDDDAHIGFDDLLKNEGAGTLATTMVGKIDAAIAAIEAIDGSLRDALQTQPALVTAAYDAVKTLNDDLKTQFVTVMNLSVPQEGAGDND